MEPKAMTVKDVLKDVLNLLNGIKSPISELETIGMPVGRAINGIKMCVDAMERDEQERARQEAELRAEQERLRAYQADSLAAVQTLSEIDFLKLTELNVRIVSELPARYNVVLGAFSSADNAQNLVSAVKAAGYNASPYQYRNGKTGVVACSSDSFVELGKSFAKLREEKFCPADAWVLVNE